VNVLFNAEGLPIESIDRIQITLNQKLNSFINFDKRNIDARKYLRPWYSNKFGMRWFIDIQAQKINLCDIRFSIASALQTAIEKGFIELPLKLPFLFIYTNLDFFISKVRQIELAFDFKSDDITIIDPSLLNQYETTFYSSDFRRRDGRQTRYSLIDLYYRNDYLLKTNKISHDVIKSNPFSWRIEFLIAANNNSNRLTLDNLSGSYHDVINRYIPYLAIIYHNYFYNKVKVDTNNHPYFEKIYSLAGGDRKRYTGSDLGKTFTHNETVNEKKFYEMLIGMKYPIETFVYQALLNQNE
jgi:hypothetical protein